MKNKIIPSLKFENFNFVTPNIDLIKVFKPTNKRICLSNVGYKFILHSKIFRKILKITNNKRVEKSKVKNKSSTVHIFTRHINNTRTNISLSFFKKSSKIY